jgi:hypothetical protein
MSLNDGLTKKEGFKPESSSPGQTSKGMRPKHDNDKVKRKVAKPKG